MSHEKIKSLFSSAVESVVSSIADYAVNPEKDFTRCKKFPADTLITFLVSEGFSSTKNHSAISTHTNQSMSCRRYGQD